MWPVGTVVVGKNDHTYKVVGHKDGSYVCDNIDDEGVLYTTKALIGRESYETNNKSIVFPTKAMLKEYYDSVGNN
jgi:hypothetical protein